MDADGVVEGKGDFLWIIAEAFGLPGGVLGEEIGDGMGGALAGERLDAEAVLHYYYSFNNFIEDRQEH